MKCEQWLFVFLRQFIILNICLDFLTVHSAIIEDPLQPIWDKISRLSLEILDELRFPIEMNVASFDDKLENRFTTYTEDMVPGYENDVEPAKNVEDITGFLNKVFLEEFKTQIKNQAEESIRLSANNIKAALDEVQLKVTRHLDQTLGKGGISFQFNVTQQLSQICESAASASEDINNINTQLAQIAENMPKSTEDSCSGKNDELLHFLDESIPSSQRKHSFEREWQATYQTIVDDPDAKATYKDCSDILWIHPEYPSGTYSIYPSRDAKSGVRVWCDMTTTSDNGGTVGGWTVLLRRRNVSSELLDFNRTWAEYREGFGDASETSEWWLGLQWVHMLTYHEPYEIMFLMHDIERGFFQAYYSIFRVEDEANQFRLIVDGFSGNVSDALKDKHHGMPFSTLDRDNDKCTTCNCAVNNLGGWWYNVCHWSVLTAPFPTSNNREAKTIKWLSGIWLVLDDVTLMIRPKSFSSRSATGRG